MDSAREENAIYNIKSHSHSYGHMGNTGGTMVEDWEARQVNVQDEDSTNVDRARSIVCLRYYDMENANKW